MIAVTRFKTRTSVPTFDAFVSYSHAADGLLAPRLRSGLQSFAKPWWRLRGARVFVDDTSLSANPHLWGSIAEAMDRSDWFVLLLSPDAAASEWVNREIEYWVGRKSPTRMLPVLTDGDLSWDDDLGDWRVGGRNAVPPALRGVFAEEPRWVDLRWARGDTDLDLRNSRFRSAIADLLSAILGVPKDQLESEEVVQHRRLVRTAWAVGILLVCLVVVAGGLAVVAVDQRNVAAAAQRVAESEAARAAAEADRAATEAATAERNAELARSYELAASALNVLDDDPELSVLLALQAVSVESHVDSISALHGALARHRVVHTYQWPADRPSESRLSVGISPDGDRLVVTGFKNHFEVWDMEAGRTAWMATVPDDRASFYGWPLGPRFTPDGSRVVGGAISLAPADANARPVSRLDLGVFVWEAATGRELRRLDVGPCGALVQGQGLVRDRLLIRTPAGVGRNSAGACDWLGAFDLSVLDIASGELQIIARDLPLGSGAAMSAGGEVVAWGVSGQPTRILQITTGIERMLPHPFDVEEAGGSPEALSPDGRLLVIGVRPLRVWDIERIELLTEYDGHAGNVFWFGFSDDGRYVVSSGQEGTTRLWDPHTGQDLLVVTTGEGAHDVGVSMTPDASRLARGVGGVVRVWDLTTAATGELASVETCRGFLAAKSLTVEADVGAVEVFCHGEAVGTTFVFDLASRALVTQVPNTTGQVVRLTADGQRLASMSASPDGGIEGLRVIGVGPDATSVTMQGLCRWDGHVPGPQCGDPPDGQLASFAREMQFSPDGTMLLMVDDVVATGSVSVWDTATGRRLLNSGSPDSAIGPPWAATFSLDGSRLIVEHVETVRIYDTKTWEVIADGPMLGAPPRGETLIPHRDDRRVIGFDAVDVVIGDLTTFQATTLVSRAHEGGIKDLSLNQDGSLLATAGGDGLVRVWSVDHGGLLHELPVTDKQAQSVAFLDDGRLLVAPQEGGVLVMTLETDELLAVAKSRVTRGFTEQECERYRIDRCPDLSDIRGS